MFYSKVLRAGAILIRKTSSKIVLVFKFECHLGGTLGSCRNIKDFTVEERRRKEERPLVPLVCVCVYVGTFILREQELKTTGSLSTGVNLGCSTRSCLLAFSHSLPLFLSLSPFSSSSSSSLSFPCSHTPYRHRTSSASVSFRVGCFSAGWE